MGKFRKTIKDVVGVLNRIAFFNSLIDTTILFCILYLGLTLINLFPLELSLIFSVFYLISKWVGKKKYYTVQLIERKFPFLKDKLTTAKDTLNDDNFVISKLRIEVEKKVSKVDASSLFDFGRVFFKTSLVIGIIFLLLFVTAMDFRLFDSENALSKINIGIDTNYRLPSFGKEESSSGGLEFNMPNEIDLNDIEDVKNNDFKREEFLSYEELKAIGAKEYKDPITEEEKEVVKNYFDRINSKGD